MRQSKELNFSDYRKYFEKKILSYCDENVGDKSLFLFYMNFWPEESYHLEKRKLAKISSKLVEKLINKKVLKEIPVKFESGYGFYEVLKHRRLIQQKKK
jgi:hypothetical protein